MSNKNNKNDLNSVSLKISKIVLSLILVVIMIYSLFQYSATMGSALETERADLEIRQDILEIDGYIFKNEEIIYSPGGNSVNYLIESGKRVGRHQLIAQTHQSFSDLSSKNQISELNRKLDILDRSNINLDFVTADVTRLAGDSNNIYLDMLKNIENGRIRDAGRNRDEMLILLNRKQLVTEVMSNNSFNNLIADATDKKRLLEAQAANSGAESVSVYSNRSGIFYYTADGYENYFTVDAVKDLNFDKFNELINTTPDANILNNALGKVAYDYNWHLVCRIEKNNAVDFITGRAYTIIYPFSSNRSVESILIRQIDSANSNEVILIFETAFIPVDFDFSRKQPVQIVFSEIAGIKVPEEALHIIARDDGTTAEGVYVQRGNVVVFRELPRNESLGRFGGYYLYLEPSKRPKPEDIANLADPPVIGQLQLYEDIITAGIDLYDGKIIE